MFALLIGWPSYLIFFESGRIGSENHANILAVLLVFSKVMLATCKTLILVSHWWVVFALYCFLRCIMFDIFCKRASFVKHRCYKLMCNTSSLIRATSWGNLFPRSLISAFVVRCLDSITPLVSTSEISNLYLASVAEQAGLSDLGGNPENRFSRGEAHTITLLVTNRVHKSGGAAKQVQETEVDCAPDDYFTLS